MVAEMICKTTHPCAYEVINLFLNVLTKFILYRYTLVDEAYNHGCVLVCSADAPPDELFTGGGDIKDGGGGGGGGGSIMDADAAGFLDLEALQFEGEAEGARQGLTIVMGYWAEATNHEEKSS
jgi:hypothetical protein